MSEPSRGLGPPEPVRLSLPSAELDLGDRAPRGPSGMVLAGCVGDFSMAGGGIGGGGRSMRKQKMICCVSVPMLKFAIEVYILAHARHASHLIFNTRAGTKDYAA